MCFSPHPTRALVVFSLYALFLPIPVTKGVIRCQYSQGREYGLDRRLEESRGSLQSRQGAMLQRWQWLEVEWKHLAISCLLSARWVVLEGPWLLLIFTLVLGRKPGLRFVKEASCPFVSPAANFIQYITGRRYIFSLPYIITHFLYNIASHFTSLQPSWSLVTLLQSNCSCNTALSAFVPRNSVFLS